MSENILEITRLDDFVSFISSLQLPVVLLEGSRTIPPEDALRATALGAMLAEMLPAAQFRTGNADGTDNAFAKGVSSVDSSRLQLVLPYKGHKKKGIPLGAELLCIDEISEDELLTLKEVTLQASPDYGDLLKNAERSQALKKKSLYILRDTLKVSGSCTANWHSASAGIFFANPTNSMKGGTGHTLRVCRSQGVATIVQDFWRGWLNS